MLKLYRIQDVASADWSLVLALSLAEAVTLYAGDDAGVDEEYRAVEYPLEGDAYMLPDGWEHEPSAPVIMRRSEIAHGGESEG